MLMDKNEYFDDGDYAELGRLTEVLGKVYLSTIIKAAINESGLLKKMTFEIPNETGTIITTQGDGIAFSVNRGTPVSMDLSAIQNYLSQPYGVN